MKPILLITALSLAFIAGCGADEAKMDPAKEQAVRNSFHTAPDVNTIKDPGMRKWVEAQIAAAHDKQGAKAPPVPPKTNP